MKVRPVERYAPTFLPMQHEFDASALAGAPATDRWQKAMRIAGTCAAVQWVVGCTPQADESSVRPVAAATDRQPDEDGQGIAAARGTATVIPLLEEALANDGRGAFGCMAVNPPAFLSEDEALDLIRKEFAKAGLKADGGSIDVPDVARPETETWPTAKRDKSGEPLLDAKGNRLNEPLLYHPRETFAFDLSFNNRTIRIEYIGAKDFRDWIKPSSSRCTVSRYDFSDAANRLRESLVNQDDLEPGIYGIFFDPLAHFEQRPAYPDTTGLTDKAQTLAREEYRSELAKAGAMLGKASLQKQIDHFLSAMKERGLIEPPISQN